MSDGSGPGPLDPILEASMPERRSPVRPGRLSLSERRAPGALYPILDASMIGDRDPGPFLAALADVGVGLAQLRGKELTTREYCDWVGAGMRTAQGSAIRVIVNDRADVAVVAGAGGVHLGQEDLSPQRARQFLGPEPWIGLSTHSPRQAAAADGSGASDYLAIGPVFSTETKADAEPVVGLEGVAEARRCTRRPLVAIGGLDGPRGREALAAGADLVAVISAVAAPSPGEVAERARELLDCLTS